MPVILERSSTNGCRLAIWEITETLNELEEVLDIIPEHESMLSNFKYDKRKLEWICSRALVKHLIPEIEQVNIIYDINGKPHLESRKQETNYHISISHSRNEVAVMVCKDVPVGIDLEAIRDRILTISKRFINEEEMNAIKESNTIDHMHVLWGAKEVIYKLYSIGELSFHNEIFINKFTCGEKGELKGFILKDNFAKSYSLQYEKINNMMLVYGWGD
jgi:4'-phosphopantetheinyl transferase